MSESVYGLGFKHQLLKINDNSLFFKPIWNIPPLQQITT
jgi:hypothetical protein